MRDGGFKNRAFPDGADPSGTPPTSTAAPMSLMERYVRFIVRHRIAVVVAVLVVTGLLATQLTHLHLEIRARANLPDEHPYVKVQNRISDLFGGDAIAVIGVIANQGDIFSPEMLGKVYRITERLRQVPNAIESSLLSIAAPSVKVLGIGSDNTLTVQPLMDGP